MMVVRMLSSCFVFASELADTLPYHIVASYDGER
jgi:hypothetical protein